jgi:hypothetical protein
MAISDSFNIARATAINTYADLERTLALLFSKLLGADDRGADAPACHTLSQPFLAASGHRAPH